jgi:FKBP-type peptidyl-prolyl cis-trans isomerase (trigger factor)
VAENQKRGVSKEVIEQQKEEIYAAATHSARERVKANYLFNRIAQKEGIHVNEEEVHARILTLAGAYQMPVAKFRKELEKRDGLSEIVMQILNEKVVDFLHENAKIEDVPAAPAPAASA